MKQVWQNIKQSVPKLLALVKAITIIDIILIAIMVYTKEDMLVFGFDITFHIFAVAYFLLLFWMLYAICRLCISAHKRYDKMYKRILAYAYYIAVIPLGFLWLFLVFLLFAPYSADGDYEECMAKCVLSDQSNVKECAFNYCDPVF